MLLLERLAAKQQLIATLAFHFFFLTAISSLEFLWLVKTGTIVRSFIKAKWQNTNFQRAGDPCAWPQHFWGVENKVERISSLPWSLIASKYRGKT